MKKYQTFAGTLPYSRIYKFSHEGFYYVKISDVSERRRARVIFVKKVKINLLWYDIKLRLYGTYIDEYLRITFCVGLI